MDEFRQFQDVGNVVLDASGNGSVRLAPVGTDWYVDRVSVKCSTHVLESTCKIYLGQIQDSYFVAGTLSGSTGDASIGDNLLVTDGTALWAVWSGGDVGAIATINIFGRQSVPHRGFRTQFQVPR